MTKKVKLIIIIVILASVLLIIISTQKPKPQKTIGISSSLIKINKNQLVGIADTAIIGTVKNTQSFIRVSKQLTEEKEVYSNVTFEVETYLRNSANSTSKEITIQILGGETPDLKMIVEGAPSFELGHKYLVFLNRQENSNIFLANIGAQGIFEVDNDGSLGIGENQKNIIKNIFNQDLTIDKLKTELDTAKPEPIPGLK